MDQTLLPLPLPPPRSIVDSVETIADQAVPHDDTAEDSYIPQQVQPQPKQRKLMLSKYTIYVTNQRMYIVGSNNRETMFRILEIDLTQPHNKELSIIEDNVFFTRNEIMKVLSGLEESSEGGLTKKLTAVGLLGFIRFTQNWYLSVITKKSAVSILGGHYLYHIDDTELIPVCNNYKKPDRNSEETRYLMTFSNLDLSKTFYFSYTYDLTNTLQKNFTNNKKQSLGPQEQINFDYNEMFVWNSFLLKPILNASFDRIYDWFQPIIHGFIDQAKISIFDAKIYITIIARRSHHFAGARFLKRGVNDQGNVANEVETEQIVHDLLTSSFHDPTGGFYNSPRYTSYIQHRGSIPLSWSQEIGSNIKFQTKPPININVVDPFYSAAALHFDDLFKRYGSPILILNLIKQREKTPRESKLSQIFEECIVYLNKFLNDKNKLSYTAWDMSRASKNRGQDVIEYLENYADETLTTTGFFHNGLNLKQTRLQQGVCRTNCIDCLDRTNAAQFIIGKRALGYQLHALGVVDDKYLEYDSDVVNILTEMFHDHGDTIALQYGGSHLVNTMETYRKINQWTSHSRDMVESIKRFYSNSFVDAQRQEAINLFLGNYVWEKGLPMLWDLNTDYYLHHDFIGANLKFKPSYTHWFTDSNLMDFKKEIIKFLVKFKPQELKDQLILRKYTSYPNFYENYFIELYIPRVYTSLDNVFEYNMNSTLRYVDDQSGSNTNKDNVASPGTTVLKKNSANDELMIPLDNLVDLTSPFETRKPQLTNSKLKNLKSSSSKKVNQLPSSKSKSSLHGSFNQLDKFNFLKLQIAQVFKNVENEYIYYPLNLKNFLIEQTPKILQKVTHDKSFPVFDNSINNSDSKNPIYKTGFYNFNLDGFQDSNKEFKISSNHESEIEGLNQQLDIYQEVCHIPKVELNDELIYYNCLNSVKNLNVNNNESLLTNEYIFNYHDSEVSPQDMKIYSNLYEFSDIGNGEFEDDFGYINAKRDAILGDEELNNNYFGVTRDNNIYNDDDDDVIISESFSSIDSSLQSLKSNKSILAMEYTNSILNNDYAINDGKLLDIENRYDQFPNIQDDQEEEKPSLVSKIDGISGDEVKEVEIDNLEQEPKDEKENENEDYDDGDTGVDDTVIHNEAHVEPINFKNEEIDSLI